jgi:2-deoxy-D-gluconate 3-dehydrogenase
MLPSMERSSHLATIFRLDGRRAVVTGGASGLGRAIAGALLEAGADVLALDRDSEALERLDPEILRLTVDVTDRESVERTFAEVDRVDVLVNAAGIGGWSATEDYPDELWDRVLQVNLTGTFVCCRAAGRRMLAAGSGSIVNVASTLGLVGFPGTIAYVASKGGIVQLTRALATAWARDRIQVNAVLPGWIDTDLTRNAREQVKGLHERVLARTPAGRWGEPADLAGIAVFLCSAASDFVTGTAIPVDGGYSVQG